MYRNSPEQSAVPEGAIEEVRQLQADLENGVAPPPRVNVNIEAALQKARQRLEAAQTLATLPLSEPSAPLLDKMLGSAQSTEDVLKVLDGQYRKAGKLDVWFLPLDEPISPYLDELIGPIKSDELETQAK